MATPLVFNQWDTGIAPSPHKGTGLIRNCDIDSYPGAIRAGNSMTAYFTTAVSSAFTADAGTDVITLSNALASDNTTGIAVTVSSSGTLPAGLSAGTVYFLIRVTSTTAKLATTKGNADSATAINITDAGSGTHTIVTVNPGTVKHFASIPNGNTFMLDSNGRVWFGANPASLLVGNTITNASGGGLVVFTNSDATGTYLFVFRNATIDVCNVSAGANLNDPVGTSSWTTAWQNLNSGSGESNSHHAIVAQDNVIYFCDDRYVGSIIESSGTPFAPATAASYTYNNQALDLPQAEIAEWLDELGQDLLIAGSSFDKIYPWDRRSGSFFLPISIGETSVKKIKNINNVVYVLAGTRGNVYRTQGNQAQLLASIPEYVSDNSDSSGSAKVTWGGIGAKNGNLLAGAAVQTTGNSGVFMVTPSGRITIDNIPASGSGNPVSIFGGSDLYRIGYSGGASVVNAPTHYTSYEAVVHSPLYAVGDKTRKATYSNLEVQIAKPTAGGSSVRVGWRANISGSFTTLATFSTDGSATSFDEDIGLTDLENIQLQVELSGSVEVVSVTLS